MQRELSAGGADLGVGCHAIWPELHGLESMATMATVLPPLSLQLQSGARKFHPDIMDMCREASTAVALQKHRESKGGSALRRTAQR